jgi:hypothetical protein
MFLQHFRSTNIAILLKAASPLSEAAGVVGKTRTYWVLALVDHDTKSGQQGKVTYQSYVLWGP